MGVVGQAVDDGHAAPLGQGLGVALLVGADHNAVVIAAQGAGRILNGLAIAKLHLGHGVEVMGQAAQLVHTHLKAGAGAGAGLCKNQRQAFARQQGVGAARLSVGLQLVGHIQDVKQFLPGQVAHFQQVLHGASSFLFRNPVSKQPGQP